ncbi:AMP deaminase 2 [Symbiodinium microadriaticum]|uniref:AMP deaminase 2 n=1 Tax=Symbiodinium microadriaticum TaxID=2951 RepID=A0A1Q9D3V6_SYMMI|nr:AMP deaminase 2 [Symbiodinium microadriaticum]
MGDSSREEICAQLRQALELRAKYCEKLPPKRSSFPKSGNLELKWQDGLLQVREKGSEQSLFEVPSLDEYYDDMNTLFQIRSSGPVSSYAYQRLRLLQTKFELYTMVFGDQEAQDAMETGHRDFYNVRKVDTHIHHSAAMNAKHLLRFMKKKLKRFSSDVVDVKDGKERTLKTVFDDMGIGWTDLCIDRLQVWADKSCLHRFDRFNNKYSPMGQNELRTIFLKTDNAMGGRYLAELTTELISDLEESKYQHAEWRLSIYGRKMSEWESLSKWVLGRGGKGCGKALLSPNIRWMIQIPRLFSLYKSTGQLDNFGQMLENIFTPLFEATLFPEKHAVVAEFIQHISGFDTVDDESKSEKPVDRTFSSKSRPPQLWDIGDNPSYKYYSYFIQTNLRLLNMLRHQLGFNTFDYRPHAGEAGEVHHLDTAFLLADGSGRVSRWPTCVAVLDVNEPNGCYFSILLL